MEINYKGESKNFRTRYFRTSPFVGRDLYFILASSNSILDTLSINTEKPKIGKDLKLFVSGDSKLPRTLLRNSGYKIVRDKDAADFIVVPYPGEVTQRNYEVIVELDSTIWLISIIKTWGCPKITKEITDAMQAELCNRIGVTANFYYRSDLEGIKCYFLRKCDEYEEMMDQSNITKRYCFDTKVPFVPTTEMNPENLEMLYRCRDFNIFEKALVGTEWQKYPFTLCVFMFMKDDVYSRPVLKLVRDAIHYEDYDPSRNCYESNRDVMPEDWNMCQRWLMYHYGLDEEKGGFVDFQKIDRLSHAENIMLKKKVAVKPVFINDKIPSKFLADLLK